MATRQASSAIFDEIESELAATFGNATSAAHSTLSDNKLSKGSRGKKQPVSKARATEALGVPGPAIRRFPRRQPLIMRLRERTSLICRRQ